MFHPFHSTHINTHMSHFSFQFYTASGRYIGEISKTAPISWSKTCLSIGNLRAIMEISISAWSSFKSTFITYLVLTIGY